MDGQNHSLYEQAQATRERSRLLAGQYHASQRRIQENWQLIRAAWLRAEQIQARRLTASAEPDRLRRSAYARLQARLASMPVIEQAKGIIMAKYGWSEDQAFDALRRASQRENVKVRDLAVRIVARTAQPAQRQPGSAWASTRPPGTRSASTRSGSEPRRAGSGGSRDRYRASA